MKNSNISEHQFPPSPQSDLFNYLRPEQQEFVKPILRVLKKPAQEELCVALIDYLETGIPEPPVTFNLGVIFMYIIHGCEPKGSDPADRKFLYPLHEVLASSQDIPILSPLTSHPSPLISNRFSTSKKHSYYENIIQSHFAV